MNERDARPPLGAFFRQAEPGRKGEILEAALCVFSERGYDGGSMREIAAAVGVSEPALYRHFPSKEAIFIALMHVAAGRIRSEAISLFDTLEASTLRPHLLSILAARRRAFLLFAPMMRTLLCAITFNQTFLTEYRTVMVEPLRERITAKASELDQAFGVKDAEDTRDARVRALMALIVGYLATSFVLSDDPDEAIADAVLRVMGWQAAVRR
jgi:AcrR family transcriptional regulator